MLELMSLLTGQSKVINSLQRTIKGLNETIKSLTDKIEGLKYEASKVDDKRVNNEVFRSVNRSVDRKSDKQIINKSENACGKFNNVDEKKSDN